MKSDKDNRLLRSSLSMNNMNDNSTTNINNMNDNNNDNNKSYNDINNKSGNMNSTINYEMNESMGDMLIIEQDRNIINRIMNNDIVSNNNNRNYG